MEFDIRIGTLLDTSKAEEQLQSFISKYGEDNDFKINLKISGDEKLEGIEKSLNNIKSILLIYFKLLYFSSVITLKLSVFLTASPYTNTPNLLLIS